MENTDVEQGEEVIRRVPKSAFLRALNSHFSSDLFAADARAVADQMNGLHVILNEMKRG